MKRLLAIVVLIMLAACATPGAATPPTAAEPAPKAASGAVDSTCATDTDCAVKNVGNCCGYYPACVNRDSPTFPDKVKATCAAEGRMSICGFTEISACECRSGRCETAATGGSPLQDR